MKRRKIDPETKTAAVLEGLEGESSVADICRKYQISESLYYRWRDNFWKAVAGLWLPGMVRKLLGRPRLPNWNALLVNRR